MSDNQNRAAWEVHYTREKSRQLIPDENIVRFFQHYLRRRQEDQSQLAGYKKDIYILEIGSGSGRNLTYLRQYSPKVYGMDFSMNALAKKEGVVCARSDFVPFAKDSFDVVIAWGLLHYLPEEGIERTLKEVQRILKNKGQFFGTLRSVEDSHLKSAMEDGDLKGARASFFSQNEVRELLREFKEVRLGFIKRQSPGDDRIIAHHIFQAGV